MDLANAFGDIALAFSAAMGGPYWPAQIITNTPAEYDDGGSIISPGSVLRRECQAQIDSATVAMREAEGFVEEDRRILVLSSTLEGGINTADRIQINEGPYEGLWMIESAVRDPAAIGYELRGRRA